MTHRTEQRHATARTDVKLFVVIALAILLAASVLTGGFSAGAPKCRTVGGQPANASALLDSYLANFGENGTVAELQSLQQEVAFRIYKYQIENDPPVQMLVISDSNCRSCSTDGIIQLSKQFFPKLDVGGIIDYNSTGGQLIAKRYGITLLPAYILSGSVEQSANFAQVKTDLIKVGSDYVIDPQVSGSTFPVY